ncbi:MAG: hypothetical protein C5B49_00520 [Bdellovibrio sp.]|nr:MAG: hypothetical protein C5B49_00520 [Bdellovibrio sp.]
MKKNYAKSFYNDIGLRLAKELFQLEYLHYGYFADLPPTLAALPQAQEKYVQKVLEQIPGGVREVLDIGCGAGGVAQKLIARNFKVTCVDPDPYMLDKTMEATQRQITPINEFYEVAEKLPEKKFDLILMSESCQYVPFNEGFAQHRRFLKPGGHVLIADFFKIKDLDEPHLSKSGHNYEEFIATARGYGFELVKEIDITKETAPTMDIYQRVIFEKVFPIAEAVVAYLSRRFPKVFSILKYFFAEKADFLKTKYSAQDSVTFMKYKKYFILLFANAKSQDLPIGRDANGVKGGLPLNESGSAR